jgi:hypothetical protein
MRIYRKGKCSFMTSGRILPRKIYFSERICSRNHESHFMFSSLFSENCVVYKLMLRKHATDRQTRNTSEYIQHPSSDWSEKKGFILVVWPIYKFAEISLNFRWRKLPQHNWKSIIPSPKLTINFVNTMPNRIAKYQVPSQLWSFHIRKEMYKNEGWRTGILSRSGFFNRLIMFSYSNIVSE